MITLEDLGLNKIDSDTVIANAFKYSAVLAAGTDEGPVPIGGKTFSRLRSLTAFGIGEGEAKVGGAAVDSIVMDARKIHSTVIWSEEALTAKQNVVKAAWDRQPGEVAATLDRIVLGLTARPAAWSTVPVFGAPTLEIGTGEDAGVDMDDVLASVVSNANHVLILTSAMLSYLRRQRIGNTGARVFDVVPNDSNSGTIDGTTYYVVNDNVAKGVAVDRSRLFVSLTPFNDPTTGSPYRVKSAGSIDDTEGRTHNLTSENKFAVIYEDLAGVAFDPEEFPVFAPAAAV